MRVPAGSWVEVTRTLLDPEQRSGALPEETRTTPYVLKLSGFLTHDGEVGDEVIVRSLIGREHRGRLLRVNPSYEHSFGETVPELLPIGLAGDPSLPDFRGTPAQASTDVDAPAEAPEGGLDREASTDVDAPAEAPEGGLDREATTDDDGVAADAAPALDASEGQR